MSLLTILIVGVFIEFSFCGKAAINLVRICQGDTTNLMCPVDRVLKIEAAKYGRFVSTEKACPHKSANIRRIGSLQKLDCVSDVTHIIDNVCTDKKECTVKATNRKLGDPCVGIFKHLDIQFYCSEAPVSSSEPAWETATPSQQKYKITLSREVLRCTQLYTEILAETGTRMECEALKAYKDCLMIVEVREPAAIQDINRVMPMLDKSLEKCYKTTNEPHIMICKNAKLKGHCINITSAISNLGEFDNAVKSIKVFNGNWALYSETNYGGRENRIKAGFVHNWLGVYSPTQGNDIDLYSNELSSLRPIDELDSRLFEEATDTTFLPTTGVNTEIQSTPAFAAESESRSIEPESTTATAETTTSTEYSQWVNLDDIAGSKHPNMCRHTYCLLGIRVIYPQLHSISTPSRQTVENVILKRLVNTYHIFSEQLVLAQVMDKSSEIILEIVDMADTKQRVIDVALAVEDAIKRELFTFTFGGIVLIPDPSRYGVTLKTVNEKVLPKRVKIVTDKPKPDEVKTSTWNEAVNTPDNAVETPTTPNTFTSTDINQNAIKHEVEEEISEMFVPKKLIYPLLITLVLLCCVALTIALRFARKKKYTLIKKVPSNVYVAAEPLPQKNIQGFENPSYLLEEVEHM